jgi:hypothetical protein
MATIKAFEGKIYFEIHCNCGFKMSESQEIQYINEYSYTCPNCKNIYFVQPQFNIININSIYNSLPKELHYKGYTGKVSYNPLEDEIINGKLENVDGLVLFEGYTHKELINDFQNAVNDFIDISKTDTKDNNVFEYKWFTIIDDIRYYSDQYLTADEAKCSSLFCDFDTEQIRESGIMNKFGTQTKM